MSVSAERASLSRLRLAGRLVVLALLVAGIVAVWLNRAALDPNAIRAAIEAHPAIAPLLFLLLHVAASLLFVPRTLLAVVAGVVFDFWLGPRLGRDAAACWARSPASSSRATSIPASSISRACRGSGRCCSAPRPAAGAR